MKTRLNYGITAALAAMLLGALTNGADAQKKYDPGATDTEIKVGNIMAYSGPASSYASIGKTEAAYFKMVNGQGGINGRKINFISQDDGYSPPKTVEQARKLVESDEVLLLFNPLGTATNSAIQKYMNAKKVPQLFVSSGASRWADPKNFPWTMGWSPSYQSEGRIWASYILKNHPDAKIGMLFQNDDFGKDYVTGLRQGLGDKADKMIVSQVAFETTSPTIDSQIVQIKAANPDIFLNIATPKFAAQAIKRVAELGWKPIQLLVNVSQSVSTVMKPAGFDNAQGIISAAYMKDPNDPQWKDDPTIKEWHAFMDKYYPEGDKGDIYTVYAFGVARTLAHVLAKCGDNLTRDNVMKQATSLDFEVGVYLPGTRIKTSPTDYSPLEQLQMMRFKGERWELFGPIISGEKND
ncbi:MAG: ABC transporter substrate-binding protein [Rhodopseudomonas sp.]|uniref:ABC transporter substrate-binding protein n=1 Tax=Rhodopseudomonas sp. TaxID=1078 RepID=UPI0017EBCD04|nr:ABC transporter substrate-binding protein [Rhodopseudomonas sp.]NVN87570.1 ABC transporter substrate-binding protein [Rhodopseudomonas sp.]